MGFGDNFGFDFGGTFSFSDIETAIITALEAQSIFQVVKTYAGELSKDIPGLPLKYPSAFVVYNGSKFEWVDTKTGMETATFDVLVCARSFKTDLGVNEDVRQNVNAGAYMLIKAVMYALAWQTLGLALTLPLKPVDIKMIAATNTMVIYGLSFEAAFDRDYA